MDLYRIKKSYIFWMFIDILACYLGILANLYEKTIGNEYKRERDKFILSKAKKILHIGCGSYPITAMVLAEMDNVNIVTIDNNSGAVKLANKIIKKKNLNEKIIVEQGDGTKYPLNDFDTIIVSSCSIPKLKVLEHVFKDAKPQTKIIIRDSILNMESIITSSNPHKNITIKEKIENCSYPNFSWNSFLLVKNN